MRVLGIETSCDETGVAIYCGERGLLANQLYSQIQLHQRYGGVVPELASRDHVRKLTPLIEASLEQAAIKAADLDGVAYTAGPGLIGALLVGAATARSLAFALDIPAVEVHHMEGHLLAPMLEQAMPPFPFVALLVSGGHTLLIRAQQLGRYELLGESVDDAVGEAFDKTAKLLGLPYPGGPHLAKLALQGRSDRYRFPRPMTNRPGLDFSFSGLKTYALNTFHAGDGSAQDKADIAAAFEAAVADTLAIKCKRALQHTGLKHLVVAGGVSANVRLREKLTSTLSALSAKAYFPNPAFCSDNGAMIALAGYLRLQNGFSQSLSFNAKAKWPIDTLESLPDNNSVS